ncbi:hypothetical protein ANABIO32_00080 [Rossellomorea marisflavi]|uniref:hypothetical protein n=1 Tax=Rossellomorea marisflavi TaxID=189381 RepID=UPI0025C88F8A|nr:hypothetical protein [Rossellomorea marisflavi]GLI82322.1 hypothetical protein ANABIO32_00080 [Rossellomorea marisflavi]
MKTTYDEVWSFFLENCKTTGFDMPKTDEEIYSKIKNGVLHMNNRLRTEYACEDTSETINETLSTDHLLILVHYIRLIFLINEKTYFEGLWQPFKKDVGLNNFNTQIKSLEASIISEKSEIDMLIRNMEVDFI